MTVVPKEPHPEDTEKRLAQGLMKAMRSELSRQSGYSGRSSPPAVWPDMALKALEICERHWSSPEVAYGLAELVGLALWREGKRDEAALLLSRYGVPILRDLVAAHAFSVGGGRDEALIQALLRPGRLHSERSCRLLAVGVYAFELNAAELQLFRVRLDEFHAAATEGGGYDYGAWTVKDVAEAERKWAQYVGPQAARATWVAQRTAPRFRAPVAGALVELPWSMWVKTGRVDDDWCDEFIADLLEVALTLDKGGYQYFQRQNAIGAAVSLIEDRVGGYAKSRARLSQEILRLEASDGDEAGDREIIDRTILEISIAPGNRASSWVGRGGRLVRMVRAEADRMSSRSLGLLSALSWVVGSVDEREATEIAEILSGLELSSSTEDPFAWRRSELIVEAVVALLSRGDGPWAAKCLELLERADPQFLSPALELDDLKLGAVAASVHSNIPRLLTSREQSDATSYRILKALLERARKGLSFDERYVMPLVLHAYSSDPTKARIACEAVGEAVARGAWPASRTSDALECLRNIVRDSRAVVAGAAAYGLARTLSRLEGSELEKTRASLETLGSDGRAEVAAGLLTAGWSLEGR